MSYPNNPYYAPAEYGCSKVCEIKRSLDLDYGEGWFDVIVVLFNLDTGMFYVGADTSYSCWKPFEKYESLDDFFGPLAARQCAEEVADLCRERGGAGYYRESIEATLCRILDIFETKELPDSLVERLRKEAK